MGSPAVGVELPYPALGVALPLRSYFRPGAAPRGPQMDDYSHQPQQPWLPSTTPAPAAILAGRRPEKLVSSRERGQPGTEGLMKQTPEMASVGNRARASWPRGR